MIGGVGLGLMLWRKAWLEAFPKDTKPGDPPYTPAIMPLPREVTQPCNRGSWRYHELCDRAQREFDIARRLNAEGFCNVRVWL